MRILGIVSWAGCIVGSVLTRELYGWGSMGLYWGGILLTVIWVECRRREK